jgi:transporter family protein
VAVLLAFFGMVCWGLAPIFGKLGLSQVHPLVALSLRTMMASTLILGWLLYSKSYNLFWEIPIKFWFFIATEAILATLVGDLAYFGALKYGNINDVTLIMSSSPLITIIFSCLLLDQKIDAQQLIGALLIICGLVLITVKV